MQKQNAMARNYTKNVSHATPKIQLKIFPNIGALININNINWLNLDQEIKGE